MVVDLPEALPPSRQTILAPRPTVSVRRRSAPDRPVEGVDAVADRAAAASASWLPPARRSGRGGSAGTAVAAAEVGFDHRLVVGARLGGVPSAIFLP